MIDLSQPLYPGIPDWDGCCGFQLNNDLCIEQDGLNVQSITTPSGIGTHMDAPSHFIAGAQDISALPLDQCIAPAVVIDVRDKVHADYFIQHADIEAFEAASGPIPEGALILGLTGWSQFWFSPDQYRNIDAKGHKHFPGFGVEAIEYLLEKKIRGIGIDTLSPDGSRLDFPVHQLVLGEGQYILENLSHLDMLPAQGATVIALPLNLVGGSESPCRVVATLRDCKTF